MRKYILLLFVLALSNVILAQEFKANCVEAEKKKADTTFYWYNSSSDFESVDDAREQAVKGLVDKIRMEYKAHIYNVGSDFNAHKKTVFSTLEPFVNDNVNYLILKEGVENECFVYIVKDSLRAECAKRKKEIESYVEIGNITYEKQNYGDALRYYYIALMLCYSHPDGDNILYFDKELNKNVKMAQWLNNRINGDEGILNSVRFLVKDWQTEGNKNIVTLNVSMNDDTPLSNINIKYNTGSFYETTNVNGGLAQLVVYAEDTEKALKSINAEVDLYYKDIERESPTAYIMMKSLRKKLTFPKSAKTVMNRTIESKKTEVKTEAAIDKGMENCLIDNKGYIDRIKQIEKAVRNGDFASVRDLFSDEGYTYFMKLKNYGSITVIGTPEYNFVKYKKEVICRSIPMCFSFNSESFTREVVFRFDDDTKLVTSLAFRLTDTAENDIWDNPWSLESRMVLMNFLEDYRTAYAFKQLEYLRKIFSDNALIIVGHVIEYKPINTDGPNFGFNKRVERYRKTKDEYMADLEQQFKNKKYINIHFTNLEVKQASGDDENVYGVQVRQYYNSSNYNDEGYLFLMVDLREELPVIHVRTWQPGKTDINDLITLQDWL